MSIKNSYVRKLKIKITMSLKQLRSYAWPFVVERNVVIQKATIFCLNISIVCILIKKKGNAVIVLNVKYMW